MELYGFMIDKLLGFKAREKDLLEILQLTCILAKVEQSNLQSMPVDRMVTH